MQVIERKVDKYLKLHKEQKEMEDVLKELRNEIEGYMKQNNLKEMEGYQIPGRIVLSSYFRSPTTAKYTTYDLEDVLPFLDDASKRKCIVEVVDKDSLESLVQLGDVPKKAIGTKNATAYTRLTIER